MKSSRTPTSRKRTIFIAVSITISVGAASCIALLQIGIASGKLDFTFTGPRHDAPEDRARCERREHALIAGDVHVGMTKSAVSQLLGEPDGIELGAAHEDARSIERWAYVTKWGSILDHGGFYVGFDRDSVVRGVKPGNVSMNLVGP